MSENSSQRYLELLKKALAFTLWPEPPIPLAALGTRNKRVGRFVLSAISKAIRRKGYDIYKIQKVSPADREVGRFWPGLADTMIGMKRLDNLQDCVESVLREGVVGDFIEAGAWRGGACIFMRAILAVRQVTDRRVFVADSFAGLPEPDEAKYPADKGDVHHTYDSLAVSRVEVERNFRKYDLLDGQVVFLVGWFKDTLPAAPIESLAILRLDGDMYESTMDALVSLYPKLSPGGFCIVDDYALAGCRAAVDEYRARNGIGAELKMIDWTGAFWRK